MAAGWIFGAIDNRCGWVQPLRGAKPERIGARAGADSLHGWSQGWWLVAGGWWLVAGGWWLVAGGWWLVAGGWWRPVLWALERAWARGIFERLGLFHPKRAMRVYSVTYMATIATKKNAESITFL